MDAFELSCLFCCWQPAHNFSFISQESLSRAIHVAEQDMKQKKEAAKNHSVDCAKCPVDHQTKIVNSREYMKRLKRRHQRDCRVGYILYLFYSCVLPIVCGLVNHWLEHQAVN